jgi:hypothetical protein
VSHAHAAHAAIPGSRLEIFKETAHFPHAERPSEFVAVLSDFIATTRAGGGPATYHDLLVAHDEAV